jgi:hypothetical protein
MTNALYITFLQTKNTMAQVNNDDPGAQLEEAVQFVSQAITSFRDRLAKTTAELDKTKRELANTRAELLANTRTELAKTTAELDKTKTELAKTRAELANTTAELENTTAQPASTTAQLANTTAQPASTTAQLANTTAQPASTTAEAFDTSMLDYEDEESEEDNPEENGGATQARRATRSQNPDLVFPQVEGDPTRRMYKYPVAWLSGNDTFEDIRKAIFRLKSAKRFFNEGFVGLPEKDVEFLRKHKATIMEMLENLVTQSDPIDVVHGNWCNIYHFEDIDDEGNPTPQNCAAYIYVGQTPGGRGYRKSALTANNLLYRFDDTMKAKEHYIQELGSNASGRA